MADSGYREFSGRKEFPLNIFHAILANALWIGTLHFNFLLVVFSLFFLPFSKFLMVIGLLLVFVVLPVDRNSKFGLRLARYICRHMSSYFPTTLHVEDINDFHPDPAYVLPIGVVTQAERTSFISLPKLKCLATSPIAFLMSRRGFVRIALWERGALWYQFLPLLRTPLHYQCPMHVVVGKPIEFKKNPQPTTEEVLEIHVQYVEALQELFEKHKARVGYADLPLKIL